jgi:predicted nucleotide-binding protein
MDVARKIELLQAQVEEANKGHPASFSDWRNKTETAMRLAMGPDHPLMNKLENVHYSLIAFSTGTPQHEFDRARTQGVRSAMSILNTAIYELELVEPSSTDEPPHELPPVDGDVFVVHGHDSAQLTATVNAITKLTGKTPVVLHEQPDGGRTVIEKFEDHAGSASFAVALLTADDFGRAKDAANDQPRARQNVILEAGYFMGRLGRSRVVLVYEEGVELPSDLAGLIYEEIDPAGRWKFELGKEMRAAGVDADLNNL